MATVTQATKSYGRNMGLSGQGSAEYWLPKDSWSINFPRFFSAPFKKRWAHLS